MPPPFSSPENEHPWRPPHWGRGPGAAHGAWRGRPRALFFRFLFGFGVLSFLFIAIITIPTILVLRGQEWAGGSAGLWWLFACMFVFVLAGSLGWGMSRAFRRIAMPLGNIMDAADAVAQGDLTVRVVERGPGGPFTQLARSFNRMVTELERADEQRRNLTADVAHELRTPLHIIQGNLEGLLDGVYDPTPDHLNATLDETRALARLVEDLRLLSLAEAGQLTLVKEPVDLTEFLTDVQTSFSGTAEMLEIELRVETEPVRVVADPGRLDQVIGNLVANALRHTPRGGCVTLAAASTPRGVRITVADTGEGISPEDLPFVFDRFWKGDRARTRAEGAGSGLGLAIARQLIHAHGGQIEVERSSGVGTTFPVEIPYPPETSED